MEKHYVFIKDNRVKNVLVFENQNDELAEIIKNEKNYDSFVWIDNAEPPFLHSEYISATNDFVKPTHEYLVSIGVASPIIEAEEE